MNFSKPTFKLALYLMFGNTGGELVNITCNNFNL